MSRQLPRIYDNPMGVMTQSGSGFGGYGINVSPTFSDIGNPTVNVAGRDLSLGGPGTDIFGGPGSDVIDTTIGGTGSPTGRPPGGTDSTTPNNRTPNNRTPNNRTPNNRTPNNRTPNDRTPNNRTPGGETRDTNSGDKKGLGIKKAINTGQEKNPRITRSELASILEGKGKKGVKNVLERIGNKDATLGGKAQNLLDKTLAELGISSGSGRSGKNSGGSKKAYSGPLLQKNLSTGGGIESSRSSTSKVTNAQKIQQTAGNKLTRSEVKSALNQMSANKVLKQIEKGNIAAGKKAVAKVKAQAKKGKK